MAGLNAASGGSSIPAHPVTSLERPTLGSHLSGGGRPYDLGVIPAFGTPHERFSVAGASDLIAKVSAASQKSFTDRFTLAGSPRPGSAALPLTVDVATEFSQFKNAGVAIDFGKGILEIGKAVEHSQRDGISKTDAAICRAVNVAVDVGIATAGTEAFLFGVPAVVALGVANPLAGAAAASVAAVALPSAAANLMRLGQAAGEIAEDKCHKLFSGSR